ncbi:hypothetical protein Ciccas_014241, partial [Cichlidogyrus casuarinus]
YGLPSDGRRINPDWSWARLSGHEEVQIQDDEDPYDEERFLLSGRKRIVCNSKIAESRKKGRRSMSRYINQLGLNFTEADCFEDAFSPLQLSDDEDSSVTTRKTSNVLEIPDTGFQLKPARITFAKQHSISVRHMFQLS